MSEIRRPRHDVPHWVDRSSAVYHIRITLWKDADFSLVSPALARSIFESVDFYTQKRKWWVELFLLMPDHLHALIRFDPTRRFATIIGSWKKWHRVRNDVPWQENFFDHRIRDEQNFREKAEYIRNNPVRAGLVAEKDDWPWWSASHEDVRFPRD